MRTFGGAFQDELNALAAQARDLDTFWSVDFHFGAGVLFVAEREVTIDGIDYANGLIDVGEIGSVIERREMKFDAQDVELTVSNFPGIVQGGARFSKLIGEDFEGREVHVYMNVVTPTGAIVREPMYFGVPRPPMRRDLDRVTMRLLPLLELYLNKRLRRVNVLDHPGARLEDVDRAIAEVVGTVLRVPGRVIDADQFTALGSAQAKVLFTESPSSNRITSITNVRWEGYVLGDDDIGDLNTDAASQRDVVAKSSINFASSSVSLPSTVGGNFDLDQGPTESDPKFLAQPITISGEGSLVINSVVINGTATIDLVDPDVNHWFAPVWVYLYDSTILPSNLPVDLAEQRNAILANVVASASFSFTSLLEGAVKVPIHTRALRRGQKFHVLVVPNSDTGWGTNGQKVSIRKVADDATYSACSLADAGVTGWTAQSDAADVTVLIETENDENLGGIVTEPFTLTEARLIWKVSVQAKRRVAAANARSLAVQVVRDATGSPEGEIVIEASWPGSDFAATNTYEIVERELDEVVLLTPGDYHFKVLGASGLGTTDEEDFAVRMSDRIVVTSSRTRQVKVAFSAGPSLPNVSRKWTVVPATGLGSGDPHMEFLLHACRITTDLAEDDGSGNLCAIATIDNCAVPDGVEIQADVVGPSANRRPDKWVTYLLRRAGVPDDKIDLTGSFATAGALYAANGYVFDGAHQDSAQTFKQMILQAVFECRSGFDWSVDRAKLIFFEDDAMADDTLELADMLMDTANVPELFVDRRSIADIVNAITLRYDRAAYLDPSEEGAYRNALTKKNQDSIDDFGELRDDDLFRFDLVANDAMAQDVLDFYIDEKSVPTSEVNVKLNLGKLALEKDDVVSFNLPEPT